MNPGAFLHAVAAALAAVASLSAANAAEAAKPAAPSSAVKTEQVLEVHWEELMPESERGRLDGPPAPIHDYLGEGGPAAAQSISFNVNQELNGATVKIPGFIVPLDVGKDGTVSEFFLVPYFGACIHVPPPPPNQIVYVKAPKGIALDSIYEAYWVTGRMQVQNKTTRLGAAAYALTADKIEVYKY